MPYKTVGNDLQYLIVVDHTEKKIRPCFQESHSTTDWILNFVFPIIPRFVNLVPYNFAIGWLYSWNSGKEIVLNELYNLIEEYPDYEIEIAGYSFGGAIAQHCGIELYEKTGIKSHLVTFGSPKPLFGLCFLWARRCFKTVEQYAHWSDIVTWCPPLPFYSDIKNHRIGNFSFKNLFNPEVYHQSYSDESLYE